MDEEKRSKKWWPKRNVPKEELTEEQKKEFKKHRLMKCRLIVCFWFLGLCNNYGYIVTNTAAMDIIDKTESREDASQMNFTRAYCQTKTTGIILIVSIVPGCIVKTIISFLPLCIYVRITIIMVLQVVSYILTGIANSFWLAVLGILCTSLYSEIGEGTLLQYSGLFGTYALSGWSSGTGAAGALGALSFTALMEVTSFTIALFIMLIVPLVFLICFLLLPKPEKTVLEETALEVEAREHFCRSVLKKIKVTPSLLPYIAPMFFVYFFEYLVNQGLGALVTFDKSYGKFTRNAQYRTMNVLYQWGVFISRSSILLFRWKQIWIMMILQGVICAVFFLDSIYCYMPSLSFSFILFFIEGVIGGLAYVNTYYRIHNELTGDTKDYASPISASMNSFAIGATGFLAIPIHDFVCNLPPRERQVWF